MGSIPTYFRQDNRAKENVTNISTLLNLLKKSAGGQTFSRVSGIIASGDKRKMLTRGKKHGMRYTLFPTLFRGLSGFVPDRPLFDRQVIMTPFRSAPGSGPG